MPNAAIPEYGEVSRLNKYILSMLACVLALFGNYCSAQLPTLPTDTRLLHIPVVEVRSGGGLSHYEIDLQASEDYSSFTFAGGVELELLAYDRADWKHWSDFDGDCQNTRQELLVATSGVSVTFTRPTNCTVSTGQWLDPYTGDTYTLASDLDIDHVIPLKYAHDHGGAVWSDFVKKLFANDVENLLAVDDGENQSKSAQGPSEWMPPNEGYHCEYVRKWDFLVNKYELALGAEDVETIEKVLEACP